LTPMTWSHACSTGVKAMDDQHGILMDTMNDLRLALVHGSGREQVSEHLSQLIEFTRLHFSSEERLLEQHGFPGIAEHRNAHQRLLGQIEEAAHRARNSDDVHLQPLLSFLRDWYLEHIEEQDQKYGAWLNERGIS